MLPWGGLREGLSDRGAQAGRRKAERSQVALEAAGLVVAEVRCGELGGEPGESRKALNARVRPQGSEGRQLGMA